MGYFAAVTPDGQYVYVPSVRFVSLVSTQTSRCTTNALGRDAVLHPRYSLVQDRQVAGVRADGVIRVEAKVRGD